MDLFTNIRIRNAEKLIEKQGGFPPGWNIDSLTNLHSIVSGILFENQDRIEDNWSVTFAELCRIIQQERAQTKYAQDFDLYLKMKDNNKK